MKTSLLRDPPCACLFAALWLMGCHRPMAVIGLRPESPPMQQGTFEGQEMAFVAVDSLQPTLRWEPFPRPQYRDLDNGGNPDRIQSVTYDLKIWRAKGDAPGQLVYERAGLSEPSHRLESPLDPCARYFWTMRARFQLEGQPRATEWGFTDHPWTGAKYVTPVLRRVPNSNYFRFRTPGDAKASRGSGGVESGLVGLPTHGMAVG